MIAGIATGALVLVVGLAVVGSGQGAGRPGRTRRSRLGGLDVPPGRLVAASLGSAAATFLVGLGLTGIVWVAVPPAIAVGLLPGLYWSRRRAVRLAATAEAWPDALRDLSASVAAGLSLARSLDALATSGPPPLREAMAGYPATARALGVVPALEVVRARLADPVADRVIEVLRVAHERGGSAVPQLLGDLADATGEDLRVEEEIRTESLEQRINARAVFVLPWLVLVLLSAREGPFRDFYGSSAGLVVIAAGAGLSAFGAVVVGRLARRETEPRVIGGRE